MLSHLVLVLFFLSASLQTLFAKENLMVFAAIGGRQPLLKIAELYEKEFGTHIIYDFGGTGRLANKVFVGQTPDVFIAGSEKWANILVEKNYALTFYPIVQHTPVIIANKKSTMKNADDLFNPAFRIALGDSAACAIGATCQFIFKRAGKTGVIHPVASGLTVKQLVFWVETGAADASIVWNADAVESGKVRVIEIPETWNVPSFIPIGVMNAAPNKERAEHFKDFVLTTGKPVFAEYGFKLWEEK